MGIFSKRRERQQAAADKIARLEQQTEQLQTHIRQVSAANQEVQARERLASKLMDRAAQGSMTSDLYSQAFPSASKYQGALSMYRSHWHGSNDHLRHVSRLAEFESPTGAAMISRLVDVVVGSGLRLQAEPMWDVISEITPGLPAANDKESQRRWRMMVEHRYKLWWKSIAPSYNQEYNGFQLDRQCFRYLLLDGEYFLVLRYGSSRRGSPLSIQVIPPEDVQGGTNPAQGNQIENGIEYDGKGAAVAYHVLNQQTGMTTRVLRFGQSSGRTVVIHNYLKSNEKQRRGIPYLSSVVHELTKLGDYEVLEIQAAIINALFAVWVKPPADEDGQQVFGAGIQKKGDGITAETGDLATQEYVANTKGLDFGHGGVMIDALPAGHEVQSFDTKRPNKGFNDFFQAVKSNLASSKGQPLSVTDLKFNESYSGARGELLVFWMAVESWRLNHGWDFHDDIYKMWLWGEYDRGRVQAPGFGDDELLRDAYANAQWIGNQRPDIDPMKSVSANVLEQKYGYKTGHQITAERGGGDYQENLETVTEELELVAGANAPMNSSGGGDVQPTGSRAPGEPDDVEVSEK